MTFRRRSLLLSLAALVVLLAGGALAVRLAPRELGWRLDILAARLSDELRAVPLLDGDDAGRPLVDVDPRRLLEAEHDPTQWLTYAGGYHGRRHSLLTQISRQNVRDLRIAWLAQLREAQPALQVSPLVADGVMYATESREGVVALDARTGEVLWTYRRPVPDGLLLCCGMPNRGAAILGPSLFVGTIDAHLVALDANTGAQKWITRVADFQDGFSITGAPLALPDRIIVGVAGSVFGVRGFLAAYDPQTGELLWRFHTVPGPGEPGNDTWKGDSWMTGGAATWTTGSYDPQQDLILWGTGNPAPQFDARRRTPGSNLFSNCVIALEARTGKLRWYYQFTPGEEHDWDSTQQPLLAEIEWRGERRSTLLWANRNAFFYALDRTTGGFLFARPFVKQTWNEGFDAEGRPHFAASAEPTRAGAVVWPAPMAATNWWPPSYDPSRQLVFVPASDAAGIYYRGEEDTHFERGKRFQGVHAAFYSPDHPTTAYVKAIDARTGEIRWQSAFARGSGDFDWAVGGVLSTRAGLAFAGYGDVFHAFDADTGEELWRVDLGRRVRGSPISFEQGGKQYVTVAAGSDLFTFALSEAAR
jgi:alcohol dehydrogenase (cytochrome c)